MAFLDMFDKLDDIVYEPVKAICEWAGEPLKRFDHKRATEAKAQEAEIELSNKQQDAELEMWKKQQAVIINATEKELDANIADFIAMKEIERNKKIIEAIKEYRHSMLEDAKEITDSLSRMDIALVAEAHSLCIQKAEEYKALLAKAMKECDDQLEEIGVRFANNERIRIKREEMTLESAAVIIDSARIFMSELNEDIKRIKDNNFERVQKATNLADSVLEKMCDAMVIEPPRTVASIDVK